MRKILLFAMVVLTIAACSNDWSENPEQQQFNSIFISDKSTDSQIDQLRYAKSNPAKNWNAWVENVRDDGPYTIIDARYGSQKYRLFLFENDAKQKAKTLAIDAHFIFTGDLGPELSLTRIGARSSPEFEFYPSTVISGGLAITQDPSRIVSRTSDDLQRQAKAAEDERLRQEYIAHESSTENHVVDICKETVLEKLRYPASGSFSWFKKHVEKKSDTKWVYQDVVTSKNGIGVDLPIRFVCTVTISGEQMSASVRMLD